MTPKRKLHAVPDEPEQPTDITALNRAEIEARDWSRCHILGDKGPRIDLPEKRRRWRWS